MGKASSSSASTSGVQTSGNLVIGPVNYGPWIALTLAVIVGAIVYLKLKKGAH